MNEKDFEVSMEPVGLFDATSHTNSVWPDEQQSAEWNGEGFPPAGTECLIRYVREHQRSFCTLRRVLIKYASEDVIVFNELDARYPELDVALSYDDEWELLPIRTAEQRAADEREQFIRNAAKIMFDVSGVIDDNSLGALFDKGCRLADKDSDNEL